MTRRIKVAGAVALALSLTACDSARREEFKAERAEKQYQAAIADYTAGRIDAAANGFLAAVRANPGNASARFQLAVLLQDARKDYLGALCCYREFLNLEPSSDKAGIARERAANCERLYVSEMASKSGLSDSAGIMEELNLALAAKDKAETANAALEKRVATLERELDIARREGAQRLALLKRMGGAEDDETGPASVAVDSTAADSVAEDSQRAPGRPSIPDVEDTAAAPRRVDIPVVDDESGPIRLNPEALALNEDAEAEESSLLPPRETTPAAPVRLTDMPDALRSKKDGDGDSRVTIAASRPSTYVVQSGDTLYKIAKRFYGRRSAWKDIQSANKATVSTDGKLRVGQVLVLP